MNRDDRLGLRRDLRFDLIDIHAERIVTIDKDGRRANFGNRAHRRDKGVGSRDDLVTMADP